MMSCKLCWLLRAIWGQIVLGVVAAYRHGDVVCCEAEPEAAIDGGTSRCHVNFFWWGSDLLVILHTYMHAFACGKYLRYLLR